VSLDLFADPQKVAADPAISAFVTANAGSGKTQTLIDRVARLLMKGVRPETILCVTYTKAAASEMQQRLFKVLGGWSVADDATLRGKLAALEDNPATPYGDEALSEARTLFAKALETPGGLKIQTIHAFCERLLRRFPVEAGLSPSFRVMDDADAAAVAAAAKALVANLALSGAEAVADTYARFSTALDFGAFERMFADFQARRSEIDRFLKRHGGLDGAKGWVWRAVDIARGTTPEDVAASAVAALDRGLWRRAAAALAEGGQTDRANAQKMAAVAAQPTLEAALAVLFNKEGEGDPARWVERSAAFKADGTLRLLLIAEQTRLERARERLRGVNVARESEDALALAAAYLEAYRIEKAAARALDFEDLVQLACRLLNSRPAAAWVLYKLDGGIDHILVDEAQDTAPEQWTIVNALTEEFFAGAGVGGVARERRLFVVGDEKQSIYSFQGAQPEQLLRQYEFHRDRATRAGFEFQRVDLVTSYRSTPQVLSFVDAVFAPPELARAIQPRDRPESVKHRAHWGDRDGCVDVWPMEVEPTVEERSAWDPVDSDARNSASKSLARKIAAEVRRLIDEGDAVWCKETGVRRPAHEGDVLILVRRRGALFEEILRALKRRNLRVAGADRLALSEHIVFDDLLALARFVRFPRDELTLAALLKSPVGGLDDDSLYTLAHGREGENLWARLQRRAGEQADWQGAATVLAEAMEASRHERPFEFYTRLLGAAGPDGRTLRQRLLHRLGAEAADALDEFLNQVLAAEARGVHDLERLAAELAALDVTVKREMDTGRPEVRVMTSHGAKGLEAPIVFLPETTLMGRPQMSGLLRAGPPDDEGFLWCTSGARDCDVSADAREARNAREDAEAYRLLYVALTRARDRLVICGRRAERTDEAKIKGWWGAVRDALGHAGVSEKLHTVHYGGMEVRRFGADPKPAITEVLRVADPSPLPAWAAIDPPPEAFARYASPSDLGQGAVVAAPSPLAAAGGLGRFRRGDLIHRLLQLLPDLPPEARTAGAARMLGREPDLTEDQRAEMAGAALAVLADAAFAEVFGPGSRAEVAIAGTAPGKLPAGLAISGRIDRLVVLPDRVLVVDFKTNRPSPARIEDADPAYLRQMALYAAVLGEVFPGRRIEAAIVWTDGPKLMPVPENLLARALAELGRGG
jgi:ATP-dependent helicase/nuclease subunit A